MPDVFGHVVYASGVQSFDHRLAIDRRLKLMFVSLPLEATVHRQVAFGSFDQTFGRVGVDRNHEEIALRARLLVRVLSVALNSVYEIGTQLSVIPRPDQFFDFFGHVIRVCGGQAFEH